jgi:serine protease AprX
MNRVRGLFNILIVLAMVVALAGSASFSSFSASAKAHPLLFQIASQNPEMVIPVIVQKANSGQQAEDFVGQLGGQITADLHIINAFAAQMTAKAAWQLSYSPAVRWVSLDAPINYSGGPDGTFNSSSLANLYIQDIGANQVWANGYQGSSVTVAVVDSGWTGNDDFRATPSGGNMRLLTRVGFNGNETNLDDHYAHGDHVMGIIGGNGRRSKGVYVGVAPKVNLVSVKVSDGNGQGSTSGVVQGLQWIYDHRTQYNIRVVNMSINSTVPEGYDTSPIDAALEILWFNQIVVVVSAGNNGSVSGILYPPANDPFVITVGSVDDQGTADLSDDEMAAYSAAGTTADGFAKPDLLAPGNNITAPLSSGGAALSKAHPDHQVNGTSYFRMSGSSMAAAVVSGAVALLLQAQPNLTPDQVKFRLMNTPSAQIQVNGRGIPYLNIDNAIADDSTQSANTGIRISQLLTSGSDAPLAAAVNWNSVNWNSVNWNSVNWNSVNWNSVNWNSVNWNSEYWGP